MCTLHTTLSCLQRTWTCFLLGCFSKLEVSAAAVFAEPGQCPLKAGKRPKRSGLAQAAAPDSPLCRKPRGPLRLKPWCCRSAAQPAAETGAGPGGAARPLLRVHFVFFALTGKCKSRQHSLTQSPRAESLVYCATPNPWWEPPGLVPRPRGGESPPALDRSL